MDTNVFEVLKQRGFVFQTSNEAGVKALLSKPGATIYEGFDPSADSLHLGHLMSLTVMHYLQEAGHRLIFILGGGTGRVGDPSGKSKARVMLTADQVAKNGKAIVEQVEGMGLVRFSGANTALMINNDEWLGKFTFLEDFLTEIARLFSVNEMVKFETFAKRLAENQPLSLFEFCYPIMQAWDFLVLFERHTCRLQIGGQDQWTNILAGADLVRRIHGEEVFALTFPLLTTASGEKMGKTEKGPVWLDPSKTSPFEFYQYLVGTPDDMLPQMLRLFTFLPQGEVDEVLKSPRDAQRRLAFEVTRIVHGQEEAEKAKLAAEKLFLGAEGSLEGIPEFSVPKEGMAIEDILAQSGSLPTKSEVKRRCSQGGVTVGEIKITDPKTVIRPPCIVKFGKKGFLKVKTG